VYEGHSSSVDIFWRVGRCLANEPKECRWRSQQRGLWLLSRERSAAPQSTKSTSTDLEALILELSSVGEANTHFADPALPTETLLQ
jgi:hypothetical protein